MKKPLYYPQLGVILCILSGVLKHVVDPESEALSGIPSTSKAPQRLERPAEHKTTLCRKFGTPDKASLVPDIRHRMPLELLFWLRLPTESTPISRADALGHVGFCRCLNRSDFREHQVETPHARGAARIGPGDAARRDRRAVLGKQHSSVYPKGRGHHAFESLWVVRSREASP